MYPQVFGKYVLERELARGGMARVVLATLRGADGFEKKLVVKQIRDELAFDRDFIRRFVEEAKTTVALNHPNIVPVYELGVETGTYFLAMELVEGVSVSELLKACAQNGERLSPEEGAYIGAEVCRALDYAHRKMSVVHRDITPRNVMVDEEGQVKIIDFGIAARASEAGADAFGTLGHMPPEQINGRELSPATDLFAVAVLLMEAWSGKPPFRRKARADVEALMAAKAPTPSDIDIRLLPLDEILTRSMAMDPKARPQDADELARVLRRFLADLDLGDIARQLGGRVHALRLAQAEAARPTPKLATETPKADVPATRKLTIPSYGTVATATFAARDDLKKWASHAPPAMGVPTPPMAFGVQRVEDVRARAEAAETREPGTRRLESVAPESAPSSASGNGPSSRDDAEEAEPPHDTPFAARLALAAFAVVAAGLALVGLLRGRPEDGRGSGSGPIAVASSGASTTATATARSSATPNVEPQASAAPFASAVVEPSAPPVRQAPTTSAALPAASARAAPARVALLGDEGTRVAVDGVARGACPVRDIPLEPGAHDVRFTFAPTGESRGERITVASGERITLRADFAGATPTVRVER